MSDRMRLPDFLATVPPGSRDDEWTWGDESSDLWGQAPDEMRRLVDDLRANGQQTPVTIGDDGRVWDGHHRVVALEALGEQWIAIRYWEHMTADEHMEALLESCDDMELRQWSEHLDRQEVRGA